MSSILKALRQLERETPPGSVDPFGAVVEPDPTATPARSGKPQRRGIAGIGLGIGLASAGLLLIGIALQPMLRTATPSEVAASQSAPAVAEVAAAQPAPSRPASKSLMPRSSVAVLSQPEAVAPNEPEIETTIEGAVPDAAPIPVVVAVSEDPVAAPTPVVVAVAAPARSALSTPPKVAPKAPSKAASSAAPKPAPELVKPKPEALAVEKPSPAPSTQPAEAVPVAEIALDHEVLDFEEIRRPLDPPVLFPVQTSWHPKVERREARLESVTGQAQVVREGDEVDGYTVLEISPSAVVFERGGETVRVRVGGS